MPILEVNHLKTYYITGKGDVKAVDDVTFKLEKGKTLGLAGESGSGKTTIGLSVMKLLPPNGKIVDGDIIIDGESIVDKDEEIMRKKYRWKKVSMIFQGAMNSLNPVLRVGDQIAEVLMLHQGLSKEEAISTVKELFTLVGLDPGRVYDYPHQFSGGMKQRAVIAMAIATTPDIIIADEPTTALDVTTQAQIIELLKGLKRRYGLSIIYITHDLGVLAEIADKVAIMYAGQIMEYGDTIPVYKEPIHPYTKGLIYSVPTVLGAKRKEMFSIEGEPPDLANPPKGCRFAPRCPYAQEICYEKVPPEVEVDGQIVRCHFAEELKDVKPEEFWTSKEFWRRKKPIGE